MKPFALGVGVCLVAASPIFAQSDEDAERVLVRYDFEADEVETGPYTLSIFEGAKGSVSLSSAFRHGGLRSVEIRDRAGDGEFAELQGFFTDKWRGTLHIHFALLVAEPEETLNVAFAGVSHFSMREHGLAIWFKTDRGVLYQVTGGRGEPLFELEAFTWYVFDVTYDVDRGTYDLVVSAEDREEPVTLLRDQTNVVGTPGSQVRKFSFIGDIPGRDSSNAWFYVDDLVITNDVPVTETPFVAPGRRMLFIDMYEHYRQRLLERPGCVPVLGYEDFDLSSADFVELPAGELEGLVSSPDAELPARLSPFLRDRLLAIREWREGCRGRDEAVERFRSAARNVPAARMYPMSEVLALVASKRWLEADALFLSIYAAWRDDPRFPAIAASIGVARGDLEESERWLSSAAEVLPPELEHPLVRRLWSKDIDPELVGRLQAEFPAEWPELVRTALTAELRFYVLLGQQRFEEAGAYADRMAAVFRRMRLPAARWRERQGDAAFYAGDYLTARSRYEESARSSADPKDVFLKLSDTHFQLGDFELERRYREKIYGSLRSE